MGRIRDCGCGGGGVSESESESKVRSMTTSLLFALLEVDAAAPFNASDESKYVDLYNYFLLF